MFARDRDAHRAKAREHLRQFDVSVLDYCVTLECRTFTHFRFRSDASAVALDDTLHKGEADTSALEFVNRVESLKDSALRKAWIWRIWPRDQRMLAKSARV
jgi:hypothetical protein